MIITINRATTISIKSGNRMQQINKSTMFMQRQLDRISNGKIRRKPCHAYSEAKRQKHVYKEHLHMADWWASVIIEIHTHKCIHMNVYKHIQKYI